MSLFVLVSYLHGVIFQDVFLGYSVGEPEFKAATVG